MRTRNHDWRLHKDFREDLEVLGILYTAFPACGAFASLVTGEPVINGVIGCAIMATMIAAAMLGYALLKRTACVRQPWLAVVGTTVVCRQQVQYWYHLNRDEDPVWQWMWANGIYDRDVHQEDDQRTFVFRQRRHAIMFKLVWGGK